MKTTDSHEKMTLPGRKKIFRILALTVTISFITIMFSTLMAQPMPGGDPGPGGGGGGTPVGGFAPIGSGLVILFALAAGYGTKKIYNARKKLAQ